MRVAARGAPHPVAAADQRVGAELREHPDRELRRLHADPPYPGRAHYYPGVREPHRPRHVVEDLALCSRAERLELHEPAASALKPRLLTCEARHFPRGRSP